jgi:hypothetical protein
MFQLQNSMEGGQIPSISLVPCEYGVRIVVFLHYFLIFQGFLMLNKNNTCQLGTYAKITIPSCTVQITDPYSMMADPVYAGCVLLFSEFGQRNLLPYVLDTC